MKPQRKSAIPTFDRPMDPKELKALPVTIAGLIWRFQISEERLTGDGDRRFMIRIDWKNHIILIDPTITCGTLPIVGVLATIGIQEKQAELEAEAPLPMGDRWASQSDEAA